MRNAINNGLMFEPIENMSRVITPAITSIEAWVKNITYNFTAIFNRCQNSYNSCLGYLLQQKINPIGIVFASIQAIVLQHTTYYNFLRSKGRGVHKIAWEWLQK